MNAGPNEHRRVRSSTRERETTAGDSRLDRSQVTPLRFVRDRTLRVANVEHRTFRGVAEPRAIDAWAVRVLFTELTQGLLVAIALAARCGRGKVRAAEGALAAVAWSGAPEREASFRNRELPAHTIGVVVRDAPPGGVLPKTDRRALRATLAMIAGSPRRNAALPLYAPLPCRACSSTSRAQLGLARVAGRAPVPRQRNQLAPFPTPVGVAGRVWIPAAARAGRTVRRVVTQQSDSDPFSFRHANPGACKQCALVHTHSATNGSACNGAPSAARRQLARRNRGLPLCQLPRRAVARISSTTIREHVLNARVDRRRGHRQSRARGGR